MPYETFELTGDGPGGPSPVARGITGLAQVQPVRATYPKLPVSSAAHLPPSTLYAVMTFVVVSPNSSKATLPVAPSKLTLAIASMVGCRADSASLALASEVF